MNEDMNNAEDINNAEKHEKFDINLLPESIQNSSPKPKTSRYII